MNKKICIYAGIFVAAMFLLTTVPTNAIDPQTKVMSQEALEVAQSHRVAYDDEQYSFPDQLPSGVSSLSCVTKRRAMLIDPWGPEAIIYDVGFSFWSMRLRDGPEHWLSFTGYIDVIWHKGGATQTITYPVTETWSNYVVPGFDFYRGGMYYFSQPFYTATVHGIVYKDMGDFEFKTRDLCGWNYYTENGLVSGELASVASLEQCTIIEKI